MQVGRHLIVQGNLSALRIQNKNITNVTTTNYQLIVTEDLSLNGRLFVSGNVGIGIGAPLYKLDVVSDTGKAPLNVKVGSTNALTVSSNGLVGIGSTTPTVALDVVGNVRCTGGYNLNYTSLPTYASNQIGYIIEATSNPAGVIYVSGGSYDYIYLFPSVPNGVWLSFIDIFVVADGQNGGECWFSSTSASASGQNDANIIGDKYGAAFPTASSNQRFTLPLINTSTRHVYFKIYFSAVTQINSYVTGARLMRIG